MKYSAKWIKEKLGITRNMLRYYKQEKLIPEDFGEEITKQYKEYNEDEVQILWGIKLLIGIGFSAKEIYDILHDSYDFYSAISEKIRKLEKDYEEDKAMLEFAKTIKLTGVLPNTSADGHIRFDEFLKFAQEQWNFYDDPNTAPIINSITDFVEKPMENWGEREFDNLENALRIMKDAEFMKQSCTIKAYYDIILEMQENGHKDEMVQRVVKLLYEYEKSIQKDNVPNEKFTPCFFAKYSIPKFLYGDFSQMSEINYGKEDSLFLAQAIAYFGGFDDIENI